MKQDEQTRAARGDDGFMLAAVLVLVFLVLLTLTIAAPRIATQLKREREVESTRRANQYVRAIRVYYKKFGHYPGSVEQLESSNNQKFLRQKYIDPLTGKDDWRLIHVGENKTTVKGFFGEDLPGAPGTGIGGAGLSGSGTGQTTGDSSTNPGGANGAGGPANPQPGAGANPTPGTGFGTPIASQSASDFKGGGGPIMGIGSSKSGSAIVTVNEQTNYQDWEFLYDPRIEQLYKKGDANAGIGSGGLNSKPLDGLPPPPAPPKQ